MWKEQGGGGEEVEKGSLTLVKEIWDPLLAVKCKSLLKMPRMSLRSFSSTSNPHLSSPNCFFTFFMTKITILCTPRFALQVGEISDLVFTDSGVHIIERIE